MRKLVQGLIISASLSLWACAEQPPPEHAEQFVSLQRGEAFLACERDSESSRRPITNITSLELQTLLLECTRTELAIFYEGEIDRSFEQMIETIARAEWRPERSVLFIHSPGGDVEAAIKVGEAISRSPWGVFVARAGERSHQESTARCYSACVFVLAAARQRVVLGQVAIHRIFPSGSAAASRSELSAELETIVERAKDFMRQNGVSVSIIDDMMSVPSSEIRILSRVDLDRYGLADENAAQLDLERLDLERRCGADFVARLERAQQAADSVCLPRLQQACAVSGGRCGAAANAQMDACVNRVNEEYGFPDRLCPGDGPSFYCEDGSISKNCENLH